MIPSRPGRILDHLRQLAALQGLAALPDSDLLERFSVRGDAAAFEALMRRHGPVVLRLCRRWLGNWHDAEDVFQATFLVLARKARAIRRQGSVGCWLHGVAYRLALRARAQARRTLNPALRPQEEPARDPAADLTGKEVHTALEEELHRLPMKYQAPLLLHYFEGQTQEAVARQLACSTSTLKRRLERGRELLCQRLTRRGLALAAPLPMILLASGLAPAAVPPALVAATVQAAGLFASGGTAVAGSVAVPVLTLSEGLLKAMLHTKLKLAFALFLAVGSLSAGAALLLHPATAADPAGEAKTPAPPDARPPEVYALFQLTREEPAPGRAPTEGDFALMRRTQAALLTSRLVLNAALQKKVVAELPLIRQQRDPVAWLEKTLQVDFPNNAELLRVGMSGSPRAEMVVVVDAVADVYLEQFADRDRQQQAERLDQLERLYAQAQEQLRERQTVLHKLRLALGLVSDTEDGTASLKQQLVGQELLDCTREIRRIRLEKVAVQVRLARKSVLGKPGGEPAPTALQLEEQLAILVEQEKLLRDEEKQLHAQAASTATAGEETRLALQETEEARQTLHRLGTERERLRLALRRQRGRILLLQRAETPKGK